VIVDPGEHDGPDAGLAQGEEHRPGAGESAV